MISIIKNHEIAQNNRKISDLFVSAKNLHYLKK